jgi:ribonuclease P protein component
VEGPPPPRPSRFPKDRRVRRRAEFTHVFENATRVQGRYFTVLVAPNGAGRARLGIVASRKLGDAVRRNRAKRLIREVFRRTPSLPGRQGVDFVVIPRRELFDAVYATVETDLRGALRRGATRVPAGEPNERG